MSNDDGAATTKRTAHKPRPGKDNPHEHTHPHDDGDTQGVNSAAVRVRARVQAGIQPRADHAPHSTRHTAAAARTRVRPHA